MRARLAISAALSMAFLLAADAASAARELFKWVDEEGFVQFSDRRPDVAPAGGYDGPKPPTVGEAIEQQREEERARREEERLAAIAEEQARAEREAAAEAQPPPPERVISRYDCQQARDMLRQYEQPNLKLYAQNTDGTFRPSTPEEIEATVSQWREAEQVLCREGVEIVAEEPSPPGEVSPPPEEAPDTAGTEEPAESG